MINVFEKNDLQPDPKADTDIFWVLLKHVIPHEKERNHIRLVSIPLSKSGIKIRRLIMQSDAFQLGKGLFDLHRIYLEAILPERLS